MYNGHYTLCTIHRNRGEVNYIEPASVNKNLGVIRRPFAVANEQRLSYLIFAE